MINTKSHIIRAAVIGAGLSMTSAAQADDRAIVTQLYEHVLTASSNSDATTVLNQVLAENWKSIGDYSGKEKTRDEFAAQIAGFHKLIPNLSWRIEDIKEVDGDYIVRGRAFGSPQGPIFGVDPQGKSFEIMSIDIHTVQNGKIVTSYHVEDWAGAIRQLSAQ